MELVCAKCKEKMDLYENVNANDGDGKLTELTDLTKLTKNLDNLRNEMQELQQDLSIEDDNETLDCSAPTKLHNFGSEDLSKLPHHTIEEDIKDLMEYLNHEKLNQKATKIRLDKHLIWQNEFVPITLFRYFVRLIYKNKEFPQNQTVRYNNELNTLEYYYKGFWKSNRDDDKIAEKVIMTISDLLKKYKPIKHLQLLTNLSFYMKKQPRKKKLEIEQYEFLVRRYKIYLYIELKDTCEDVLENLHEYSLV